MSTPNLELLWVLHENAFHYQCICMRVLELLKLGSAVKAPPVIVPDQEPVAENVLTAVQNTLASTTQSSVRNTFFDAFNKSVSTPKAREFIRVGVWMDCPACRTRYRVTEIDYDTSAQVSGKLVMELGAVSGAMTPTGARIRMLLDDE